MRIIGRFAVALAFSAAALVVTAVTAGTAQAGPYSDELSKCLVKSTTSDDKSTLVRWIFSISALHPAVSTISAVTGDQRDQLNRDVARLVESLLTVSCKPQTQEAIRYEGASTLETSFSVLGEAAMMEMMSHRQVAEGFGAFAQYLDEARLKQAFGTEPTAGK